MFHRRKAAHHAPPSTSSPSSAAALAATQAVRNQQSNVSLSSAAAATALRSHTPPPTNPAELQTKRMARRGSTSSQGSAARAQSPARPGLQRSNSNGSMTERSFRSPSPNRKDERSRDVAVQADPNAPPVPYLPRAINAPNTSHRRASSVEPQSRIASPPPSRPGGRGISVDGGPRTQQQQRVTSLPPLTTANDTSAGDSAGRRSVNFSRPMSPQNGSPQPSSPVTRTGRSGWFTSPIGTNAQPRQDVNDRIKAATAPSAMQSGQIQQSLQQTADRPVKTKKKAAFRSDGTSLAQAASNMDQGHRKQTMVYDPNTRTMRPLSEMLPEPEPEPEPDPVPAISSSLAARVQKGNSPTVNKPSPFHHKATSTLSKQPSMVRERREEEEEAEAASPREQVRTAAVTLAQPKPERPPQQHHRAASLELPMSPEKGREASLSPARQAHFSAVPVTFSPNDFKHNPPPRSLSPAKPALKHSPSSSVRTASPVANFATATPKAPPSDVSASGSEEGVRSFSKKKGARVSFGDEPVEIIPIPEVTSPASPAPTSGLSSSKHALMFDDDSDFEMSPRPVLPSFGSVRGRSRESSMASDPVVKVTETVPSSMSTSAGSITSTGMEHSSDHAVGGILARDLDEKKKTEPADDTRGARGGNEPLPPEVTSVEGSGYISDSDASEMDGQVAPAPEAPPQISEPVKEVTEEQPLAMSGATLVDPSESKSASPEAQAHTVSGAHLTTDIPVIAVQPATPAAAEEGEGEEWQLVMPGGAAGIWDDEEPPQPQESTSSAMHHSVPVASVPSTTPSESNLGPLPTSIPEEESDTSSIYSDAEEELSDLENFASLDAILESPIEPKSAAPTQRVAESSPLKTQMDAESSATDWNESKEYWSRLSEQRKRELEQQARQKAYKDGDEAPAPVVAQPAKQKKKKSAVQPMPVNDPVVPPKSEKRQSQAIRSTMRQSDQRAASQAPREEVRLRKSMRGTVSEPAEPEGHHFRTSMRSGPMPSSMRGAPAAGLQSSRYASPPPQETRGALQKKNIPISTAAPRPSGNDAIIPNAASKAYAMPLLLRSDSDASDSSFKRARPSTSVMSDGEGYSMRRSMRGAAPAPAARAARPTSPPTRPRISTSVEPLPPPKSSRFSLRSLSPSMNQRNSMRTSIDSAGSPQQPRHSRVQSETLRSSKSPTRLFSRETKATPAAPINIPAPSKPPRAYKSRFADSDDEDDSPVARRPFRSRFADSDDEDDSPIALQDLAPVRGIPRKPGDEDRESTDLEEESVDNLADLPSAGPKGKTEVNGNTAEGAALSAGSMRTGGLESSKHAGAAPDAPGAVDAAEKPKKEKRGFFGMGRKKRGSSVPPPQSSSPLLPSSPTAAPKLLRRSTPQSVQRLGSDSWPLAPPGKIGGDDDDRPNTSDGAGEAGAAASTMARPDVGNRRSTVDGTGIGLRFDEASIIASGGGGEGEGPAKGYSSRTGKKKKFPMLRKAFRLDD